MRERSTAIERHSVDSLPALTARLSEVYDRPVMQNEFPKTEDMLLHGQLVRITEVTYDESHDMKNRYDPLRYGRMYHFITDYGYEGYIRDGEDRLYTGSYISEFFTPGDIGVEDSERMESIFMQHKGIVDAYLAAYEDVEARGLGNIYNKDAKLYTVWAGAADALSEPVITDTICDRITLMRGSKVLKAKDQPKLEEGWTRIYPLTAMFYGEETDYEPDEEELEEFGDPSEDMFGDGSYYIRTSALKAPVELTDISYDPATRLSSTSVYGAVRPADEQRFRQNVVTTAGLYLGTQYSFAKKDILGIDCSGLCSMAYMLNGVYIYRDARIVEGFPVKPVISETEWETDTDSAISRMKPGDLIYYPGHVVMYMGEGRIIHSTARAGSDGVVINSLRPGDTDYAPWLREHITAVGTIFA